MGAAQELGAARAPEGVGVQFPDAHTPPQILDDLPHALATHAPRRLGERKGREYREDRSMEVAGHPKVVRTAENQFGLGAGKRVNYGFWMGMQCWLKHVGVKMTALE